MRSLGPVSLAAQSVIVVSGATSFQAPFSIAVAVSVRYVLCHDILHSHSHSDMFLVLATFSVNAKRDAQA